MGLRKTDLLGLEFRVECRRIALQHAVNGLHAHALLSRVVVATVTVARYRAHDLHSEALTVAVFSMSSRCHFFWGGEKEGVINSTAKSRRAGEGRAGVGADESGRG